MGKTALERAEIIRAVRAAVAGGVSLATACADAGTSVATYQRLAGRYDQAGMDGLEDLPRTGRPGFKFSEATVEWVNRIFIRTNRSQGCSSMVEAWRVAAKDPESPLTEAEREVILRKRSSKHSLVADARRSLRRTEAVIHRYRDPASGTDDGCYVPGRLRLASDGTRRVRPGEREVWDDASVNVGIRVDWPLGGDKCSDKWGCRVGRYQLLAVLDCATDLCKGFSYVIHYNDAYNGSDVCGAVHRSWLHNGYAPDECVMEGGSWQAGRTKGMLTASGTRLVSAKGKPNQKLIEPWFGRVWTDISAMCPAGQIGRYRGEMVEETKQWMRCREGVCDPREHFMDVADFMRVLERAINFRNSEPIESRTYGTWVPSERYEEARLAGPLGHAVPQGLRRYALPVREERVIRRQGMVKVLAECPFGWKHEYVFFSDKAWLYDGALATVSFDPDDIRAGAVLELAADWKGTRRGTVIDEAATCVSPAPLMERAKGGLWGVSALDARDAAKAVKRSSRAAVKTQSAAFDGRGTRFVTRAGFAETADPAAAAVQEDDVWRERAPVDWASLEAAAGVMVS